MRAALILAALSTLIGCGAQQKGSPETTSLSSLELVLVSPSPGALGSPDQPIAPESVTFNLSAVDFRGNVWPQDLDVQVYVSYGGVKTGMLTSCGVDPTTAPPIATIHLTQGVAMNQVVPLPATYGPTALWLDEPVSHATGASPTIYFRNPFISEVQTPIDLTATNATYCSPFNGRYVVVDHSASATGQLVVTSVFIDSFAVTDTGSNAFNSMYIYSFGQPPDDIVVGRVMNQLSGDISKFVGFTELNFPLFDAADDQPLVSPPPPVVIAQSSLANRDNVGLLANDASVVQFTGTICDPSPPNPTMDPDIQSTINQWNTYDTFVLDGDGTCSSLTNFAIELPSKVFGTFDPLQAKGKTATVVGMFKNSSGQNPVLDANGMYSTCSSTVLCQVGVCVDNICKKGTFNFWTILPRTQADIVVQ